MARNRQRRLQALYDRVPDAGCQGLCERFCCVVPMGLTELERIERSGAGVSVSAGDTLRCPLLTPLGRCSVYADRPLICRLWGVTEGMECPHGCRPERLLSRAESNTLLADLLAIDADHEPVVLWSRGVRWCSNTE